MEYATAAQRLRDAVELAAHRIGERPLIGRHDLVLADALSEPIADDVAAGITPPLN